MIRKHIFTLPPETLFSPKNFLDLASLSSINKSLLKMKQKGEIIELTKDVYYRPVKSKFVGNIPIQIESIITTLFPQETIQIHGAEAARQLKLSTQMPIKTLYYTSGKTRKVKIGNRQVYFVHISDQRILQHSNTKIGLVISALFYLGVKLVTKETVDVIKSHLTKEEFDVLINADLPKWMKEKMHQ